MELIVVLFGMTVWYVSYMPAFVPVAICVSALFAILSIASPKSAWIAFGLAAMSAFVADIGFLIVWIAVTGQFGPLIGLPLFFLWIIGMALAVPTILAIWICAKAIAKNKA
jgi:hypothetical protein